MPKPQRRLIADGVVHKVECAVRKDGFTSPASDFLDQLESGMIDVGVRRTQSTDAQIHVADWVEAALERFADNGSFPSRKYNQLKDGIWELKHYKLRIAFFDTPGDGTYSPKINWEGQTHWNPPTLPEFDPIIRLALGFPKPPDNFVEHHIERARMIREEDVQHDLDV